MRVLLDTHVALWLDAAPKRINAKTLRLLSAATTEVWLSTVSCAEMAVKMRRGKLRLDATLEDWLDDRVARYRWRVLDLRASHAAELVALPSDHRDPFDLLLAAQGRAEGLGVVTADPAFDDLGVPLVAA